MGWTGRHLMSLLAASCTAAALAFPSDADAAGKHKVFLSMSYIGNDWQAEAANMVKAMAASERHPEGQGSTYEVQVAGPERSAPDPADQRHGAGGSRCDRRLPDLADGAEPGGAQAACAKGVLIFAYDAVITEPCAHNTTINQEDAGRQDRRMARRRS